MTMNITQKIHRFNAEHKLNRSLNLIIYLVILLFVIAFIAGMILNYSMNWPFGEYADKISGTVRNGLGLNAGDFWNSFSPYGDAGRVRYLSYFFSFINTKIRIWLWNYIPPHPSFSVTWLFTIILSPVLLFKFMNNYVSNRDAAWNAVLLYMVSTGYISGIVHLSHPGKPMILFMSILCLYMGSKINISDYAGERLRLLVFFFVLLISFYFEEYSIILYAVLPVIFYIRSKASMRLAILYVAIFGIFLASLVVIAYLNNSRDSNIWEFYVNSRSPCNSYGDGWQNFSFKEIPMFFNNLFIWYTFPAKYISSSGWYRINVNSVCVSIYYLSLLVFAGKMFTLLKMNEKKKFARLSAGLVISTLIFAVGQQYVKARWIGGFYYGCMFPLFFAMPFSILLSPDNNIAIKILNKCVLISFVLMFAYNSHDVVKLYSSNNRNDAVGRELSFSAIKNIWKNRYDKKYLSETESKYPRSGKWLFEELKYTDKRKTGQVKA